MFAKQKVKVKMRRRIAPVHYQRHILHRQKIKETKGDLKKCKIKNECIGHGDDLAVVLDILKEVEEEPNNEGTDG